MTNDEKYVLISRVGPAAAALAGAYEGGGGEGAVASVNGKTGDVVLSPTDIGAATAQQGSKADSAVQPAGLTKTAVGLDNVDNTSDATKPVSTPQQNALNLKANQSTVSTLQNTLSDVQLSTGLASGRIKPLNREIAIFGDSRTANCVTSSATAYALENYGYAFWATSISGVAFLPVANGFGVGGDTTAMMLARIAPVVASSADIVLFLGSTNDRTATSPVMTVADTKRNITAIVRRLNKAGKIVVVGNETPRFGAKALTTQQQLDHEAVRDWITNELSKVTPVVDTYTGIVDADLIDGLHPGPSGARKIGKAYATALSRFLKQPVDLPVDSLDQYSSVDVTGSLITNPLLTGSASLSTSSVNPSANSVIATGYKVAGSAMTGLVTAGSKKTATTGIGEAQVFTFTGAATTAGGYLAFSPTATFTLPTTNLAVGDVISLVCGYDIVGDNTGLLSVEAELIITKPVATVSTTIYYRDGDKYVEPFGMSTDNVSGSLDTQRYTWDGTETVLVPRISIYFKQNATQNVSVEIRQIALRRHVA